MSKERIEMRQRIRAEIFGAGTGIHHWEQTLLLISESLDDYIEHRIRTDKILEEILKDIQNNTASMAETKIETILTENLN